MPKQAVAVFQKDSFKGQRREIKEKEKCRRSHLVREEEVSETEDASIINTIYSVSQNLPKVAPFTQNLNVNGMDFKVYTGCGVIIISKEQYSKLW